MFPPKLRVHLVALFLFVLATILLTYPLSLRAATDLTDAVDPLQAAWVVGWDVTTLLDAPLRLYEAPTYYPYPHTLAYLDSTVPQSVMAMPPVLATGNVVLGYNFALFVAAVLSAFGAYLLVRELGGNALGGIATGLAFSFASYKILHLGHLNIFSSEWFPFCLLFLYRTWRKPDVKNAGAFGLYFFLQAASAFYYAFIVAVMVALWLIWYGLVRRPGLARRWEYIAAAALIAGVCLLPLVWPDYELSRDFGLVRTLGEAESLSARPASYLVSLSKNPFIASLFSPFHAASTEDALFPGLFATVLAAFALLNERSRQTRAFLLSLALVGFILSLGPQTEWNGQTIVLPYFWLRQVLPGFQTMRSIARWGVLVLLAVSLLAGLGLSTLIARLQRRGRGLALAAGVLVLLGMTLEYSPAPLQTTNPSLSPVPPIYRWLATRDDVTAIVELPSGKDMALRQYYTLVDHKPMLGGSSGVAPPNNSTVDQLLETFPTADSLDLLREMGVNYVLVHSQGMDAKEWAVLQNRLAVFRQQLVPVIQLDGDYAFKLQAAPPAPGPGRPDFVVPDSISPGTTFKAFLVLKHRASDGLLYNLRGLINLEAQWNDATGGQPRLENIRVPVPLFLQDEVLVAPFDLRAPSQPGSYQLRLSSLDDSPAPGIQYEHPVQVRSAGTAVEATPAIQLGSSFVGGDGHAGNSLQVTLFWQVRGRVPSDYDISIGVLDAAGKTVASLSAEPFDGSYPTSQWLAGSQVAEEVEVPLPHTLPQGHYQIEAGLVAPESGKPVEILGPAGQVAQRVPLEPGAYVHTNPRRETDTGTPALARFDVGAELYAYSLKPTLPAAGDTITCTLRWRATQRIAQDYEVSVRVVDSSGQIVAQQDGLPRRGLYPTFAWDPYETVVDRHSLVLPPDLPPGTYRVQVGLYSPANGQSIAPAGGAVSNPGFDLASFVLK